MSNCFSALQRAENSSIVRVEPDQDSDRKFQCSSASRKFLNIDVPASAALLNEFQCSSASRKFLNADGSFMLRRQCTVSVLFSEPKIPQWKRRRAVNVSGKSFSALQRAENSSIRERIGLMLGISVVSVLFSEPKIPQSTGAVNSLLSTLGFSALQRAENSSIFRREGRVYRNGRFQCSSASRKFLNARSAIVLPPASNVSVLFSEPKIPQSQRRRSDRHHRNVVSVLFSEPKIPQFFDAKGEFIGMESFSALQRAENSSMQQSDCDNPTAIWVSVLFSEPKIPQFRAAKMRSTRVAVSVLFSEPKIPQFGEAVALVEVWQRFQCSSASRKFLNDIELEDEHVFHHVSVLFSEPKIPQFFVREGGTRPEYAPFQCSSASRKFLNVA